jgi:Domain of unknown function (DUF5666)
MALFLAALMLGAMTPAQASATAATPQAGDSAARIERPNDLLAPPKGKTTVIGGTISSVDPVTDVLMLKVFGGKRMKIFFDERTQVYRDGAKSSLRDLHTNDRASVETLLDGTTVFARSIHMLSQAPEGECQGQVISYDSGAGLLTVNEALSNEPIRLHIPASTEIRREGQAAADSGTPGTSDLVKGALIRAEFQPDNKGQGIASRIAILAKPGEVLSFNGTVSFLDLRSSQFAVLDTNNGQSYKISFDPAGFPTAHDLHEGSMVKVTAEFDGSRYQARSINILH